MVNNNEEEPRYHVPDNHLETRQKSTDIKRFIGLAMINGLLIICSLFLIIDSIKQIIHGNWTILFNEKTSLLPFFWPVIIVAIIGCIPLFLDFKILILKKKSKNNDFFYLIYTIFLALGFVIFLLNFIAKANV